MLQNERGQTATEYSGMLLVVALIVAALATSSVAAGLAGNIEALVCQISGQTCTGSRAPDPRSWTGAWRRSTRC